MIGRFIPTPCHITCFAPEIDPNNGELGGVLLPNWFSLQLDEFLCQVASAERLPSRAWSATQFGHVCTFKSQNAEILLEVKSYPRNAAVLKCWGTVSSTSRPKH